MKKLYASLLRFWGEDRSLTVMLLLLLSFIFVFVPAINDVQKGGAIFMKTIYFVILLTGILSVAKTKKTVIIVSIFAVADLLLTLSDARPGKALSLAHDFGGIVLNFAFAVVILIKTFQPGDITFHRIEGSIVVYLLLGMVFAFVFHAVHLMGGGSSFNNIGNGGLREFLYFSFTSLTTMGYGDITPVHPLARSLANFEALIGQLYPAILIARLVSMEFEASQRRREKNK